MKVCEFVRLDKGGIIFKAVDATKVGYMLKPSVLIEADKNVLWKEYGNYDVVGFDVEKRGKTITLYIKDECK